MMNMLDDKSEIVAYNVGGLPLKSGFSTIDDYPTLSGINHWHTDFEFSCVTKGKMLYSVNGEECELTAGQMIFVNSAQMHYGLWREKGECEFICMIVHPSVFENSAVRGYIEEITGRNTPAYMIFDSTVYNEKTVVELVTKINAAVQSGRERIEAELIGRLYLLLGKISESVRRCGENAYAPDVKKLDAMHRMVGFIQKNYASKLTLEDIAYAGMVCRSGCCEIFRRYLHKTPVEFLNEYRISKSIELLPDASLNMTRIAELCGFNSSSYFTETFTRLIKCTPSEYRKRN